MGLYLDIDAWWMDPIWYSIYYFSLFLFLFEIQLMIHWYTSALLSSKIMNLFFWCLLDGWLVGSSILWGTTKHRSYVFHFGFSKRLHKPVGMISMIVKASFYYVDTLLFIGKVPMKIYDGVTILVNILLWHQSKKD